MKLFMNALVFAPSDDVPPSLAEAVATGYKPEVVAKEVSTEDKAGACPDCQWYHTWQTSSES